MITIGNYSDGGNDSKSMYLVFFVRLMAILLMVIMISDNNDCDNDDCDNRNRYYYYSSSLSLLSLLAPKH